MMYLRSVFFPITERDETVRFWDAPPGERPVGRPVEHPELAARVTEASETAANSDLLINMLSIVSMKFAIGSRKRFKLCSRACHLYTSKHSVRLSSCCSLASSFSDIRLELCARRRKWVRTRNRAEAEMTFRAAV